MNSRTISEIILSGNFPNVDTERVSKTVAQVTGQSTPVRAEAAVKIRGLATAIEFTGLVISSISVVIEYLSWRRDRRDDGWTVDKLTGVVREKLAERSLLDFEIVSLEGYEHLSEKGEGACVVKVRAKKNNRIFGVVIRRTGEALFVDLA